MNNQEGIQPQLAPDALKFLNHPESRTPSIFNYAGTNNTELPTLNDLSASESPNLPISKYTTTKPGEPIAIVNLPFNNFNETEINFGKYKWDILRILFGNEVSEEQKNTPAFQGLNKLTIHRDAAPITLSSVNKLSELQLGSLVSFLTNTTDKDSQPKKPIFIAIPYSINNELQPITYQKRGDDPTPTGLFATIHTQNNESSLILLYIQDPDNLHSATLNLKKPIWQEQLLDSFSQISKNVPGLTIDTKQLEKTYSMLQLLHPHLELSSLKKQTQISPHGIDLHMLGITRLALINRTINSTHPDTEAEILENIVARIHEPSHLPSFEVTAFELAILHAHNLVEEILLNDPESDTQITTEENLKLDSDVQSVIADVLHPLTSPTPA